MSVFVNSAALWRGVRAFIVIGLLGAVSACGGAGGTGADTPPVGAQAQGEYPSFSSHFVDIQSAGLNADYAAFAEHLKAEDPAAVIQRLQRSFRGKPFDAVTTRAAFSGQSHRRAVMLRNATGRLYLYVELEKIGTRWSLARYDLGRDKAIAAKL